MNLCDEINVLLETTSDIVRNIKAFIDKDFNNKSFEKAEPIGLEKIGSIYYLVRKNTNLAMWKNDKLFVNKDAFGVKEKSSVDIIKKIAKQKGISFINKSLETRF